MLSRSAFLAGDHPDAVAIYLADAVLDAPDTLAQYSEQTEEGQLLVIDGDTGRRVFKTATGTDAMAFAKQAMANDGTINRDLGGGTCPDCGEDTVHILLAFVEEQNEAVGGLYAEGDVLHAYAKCACGTNYSEKWTLPA